MQDKLKTIAENSVALHDMCVKNHFVATVVGDGGTTLSFRVPFEPDMVQIFCTDPRIRLNANSLMSCAFDLRALGGATGMQGVVSAAGVSGGGATNTSLDNYITVADGTVTIHELRGLTGSAVFGAGYCYMVTAVRYTEQTDRERLIAFVESLTGTGTAEICKAKKDAAFTQQEWAALTATRPNWTFKEV